MRRIVLYFLCLGVFSLSGCTEEKPTKLTVLSSIKPIQSIVSAVGGDNIISQRLIPDYASPHHYAFKPSDLKKLSQADLVFRIDEHFEVMLNPALKNLSNQSKIISLADKPTIKLLPLAEGDHHQHGNEEQGHDEEEHDAVNLHIFTSPKNMIEVSKIVADSLSKIDADNTQTYQLNAKKLIEKITKTTTGLKQNLAPYKDVPYVIFHNSWQYFANEVGLQKPIIVNLQEGVVAGGKTINRIRSEIASKNIHCVFKDPEISEARVKVLTENSSNTKIKSVTIDVLGKDIIVAQGGYIQWLKNMGSKIEKCLK